jgi:tRNA-dihydrouridine synthase
MDHLTDDPDLSVSPSHRLTVSPPSRTFATIDVNLACPVKKIDRKARGGHWLAEPEGAVAILEAVREAVPREIPCTVKLRRAYDDTPEMASNFDRVLDAAFRIGYAWATVHARTVEQKYVGPSRWDLLRDIVRRHRENVIFGSGDVWEAADIFRMLSYTGVAGVAVARGCIGNPWIFRQARAMMAGEEPVPPTIQEQRTVLEEHFELALRVNTGASGSERKAEEFTGRTMRKFGIRFAEFHPRAEEVRRRFIGVESLDDWRAVLRDHYGPASAPGAVTPMLVVRA